jgi:histidinol-phosphate aminotransferase
MRLGVSYASQEIIDIYNKVKYPYNINILTQRQALKVLDDIDNINRVTAEILDARNTLVAEMAMLDVVEKIYPSDANFVLVQVSNANAIYAYLRDSGVIVRNRSRVHLCGNCLRITVGNDEENQLLIEKLQEYGSR